VADNFYAEEPTAGDRAIIAAIELLRARVTQLPLAMAQNAAMAAEESLRQSQPAAGGDGGGPRQGFFGRGISRVTAAADLLAARFSALLGPLASFGTYLNAPTSGMSVLSKAINLFAASVAPVILPATVLLSTALAAAGDVVFKKLVPALEGFYKLVLSSGIPAVQSFVSIVGRATQALIYLADSAAGKALLQGGVPGGKLGALDRLTGGGNGAEMNTGSTTTEAVAAYTKFVRRNFEDAVTAALPYGGETLAGANAWMGNKIGGLWGLSEEDADARRGMGTRSGSDGLVNGATKRAQADVLKELMLSFGPKASVGSVSSIYSRAAMSSLGQTPFERRMLEMMQTVVSRIGRAANEPGRGVYTPPAPPRPPRAPRGRRMIDGDF
jgi:hypothetical protein